MQLKNEIKECFYKYNLDCTDKEEADLKKFAIERFANDPAAQIQYAVITIFSEALGELVDPINIPIKLKKSKKIKEG